ncbi:2-amino-4-hydroxy-6-hydroxymethyldihydropteridine diphosphokinase [Marinospirillum sp. MEB164]|uniref:2-amino-4-hydroxy-6-hydroxymethyldihydropteridine diphosphokinase n=1 Tax=Marinospirillum alkalitolerans TaxID=3123374 RepID=A0ABW8PX43_9GAMM
MSSTSAVTAPTVTATASQVRAWVSLGSNHERHFQIGRALDALQAAFGPLIVSRVYETQPVGIKVEQCAPFYNLVAGFMTQQTPDQLQRFFKSLEADTKYLMPEDRSIYVRALDLDLISWGDFQGDYPLDDQAQRQLRLPYPQLLKHDFVLRPLAELIPNESPAGYQQSYAELWSAHAHTEQVMRPVTFTWMATA